MTEEQFGRIVDDAVEGIAEKIDNSIELGMKCKGVRIFTRLLSVAASLALIAGAGKLRATGHTVAAKVCLMIGLLALIFEVIRCIVFEKE